MIKLFKDKLHIDIDLPFFAQKKYLASKSENYGWFVSDNFILPFIIYKKYRSFSFVMVINYKIYYDS